MGPVQSSVAMAMTRAEIGLLLAVVAFVLIVFSVAVGMNWDAIVTKCTSPSEALKQLRTQLAKPMAPIGHTMDGADETGDLPVQAFQYPTEREVTYSRDQQRRQAQLVPQYVEAERPREPLALQNNVMINEYVVDPVPFAQGFVPNEVSSTSEGESQLHTGNYTVGVLPEEYDPMTGQAIGAY